MELGLELTPSVMKYYVPRYDVNIINCFYYNYICFSIKII